MTRPIHPTFRKDGWSAVDEFIGKVRLAGGAALASNLDYLLHRVAWTTGSELRGELRMTLETAIQDGQFPADPTLQKQAMVLVEELRC